MLDFSPPSNNDGGSNSGGDSKRFSVLGTPIYLAPATRASLAAAEHEVQTASSVWDCSVVLAKFLEHAQKTRLRPSCVLHPETRAIELGAGTGLAGLATGILLANTQTVEYPSTTMNVNTRGQVILTDVADVVGALNATIALNHGQSSTCGGGNSAAIDDNKLPVSAAALDWTRLESDVPKLGGIFDLVIAADVVWVERLV